VLILAVRYVSERYSPAFNATVLFRGALVPSVVHFAHAVVAALLPIQSRAAEPMVTILGIVLSFRRNPLLRCGGKDQPGRGSRRFDPRSF
jgi:hypothetical protein